MKKVSIVRKPGPTQFESFCVSFTWFELVIKESDVDAAYNAKGNDLSGLSRVEVCEGGEIVALFDDVDPDYVRILTKTPSEALRLEAERVELFLGV